MAPRAVCGLRAQHLAHRIPDRHQSTDDPGGLWDDPLPSPALVDGDRCGGTVHDLHQAAGVVDKVRTLLDRGAFGCSAGADGLVAGIFFGRALRRREDVRRQPGEGRAEQLFERRILGPRSAGVGRIRPVDAAPLAVLAEHHLGMRGEIFVDLKTALPGAARLLLVRSAVCRIAIR